ncbi:MAG: hypothetical protein ACJAYU_003374 [Bradymonadia bacterium]
MEGECLPAFAVDTSVPERPIRDVGSSDTAPDTAPDSAPDAPGDLGVDTLLPDSRPEDGGTVGECESSDECLSGFCAEIAGRFVCVDGPCAEGCPDGMACVRTEVRGAGEMDVCAPESLVDCVDADLDRYGEGEDCLGPDCDDLRRAAYPGAPELCDLADNDCDGRVDEEITFENACGGCDALDGEPDGPCGICESGAFDCDSPESVACIGGDDESLLNECGGCDVLELAPGAVCGACSDGVVECDDAGGVRCVGARPAPPEICDGADNDCDGEADENNPGGGAGCNSGRPGVCTDGVQTCDGAGGYACIAITSASSEICDGLDNDCDTLADEGVLGTFFQDGDGDGAGNPDVIRRACEAPPGYVLNANDCNDVAPAVITGECDPGATRLSACGNCGSRNEVCSLSCAWAPTGSCLGEGECSAGTSTSTGCGACSARTCTSACVYEVACGGCNSLCRNTTVCGYGCPDGYHSESVGESISCGSGGFGANVACHPTCGDNFSACGYSCPTGYHVESVGETLSCSRSGFGANVRCHLNAGTSFTTCGSGCPSGYAATASGESLSCGRTGFGRYTRCTRI